MTEYSEKKQSQPLNTSVESQAVWETTWTVILQHSSLWNPRLAAVPAPLSMHPPENSNHANKQSTFRHFCATHSRTWMNLLHIKNWQTLLYMQGARHYMCIHQMAALFSVKYVTAAILSVMSNRKLTMPIDAYSLEERSKFHRNAIWNESFELF